MDRNYIITSHHIIALYLDSVDKEHDVILTHILIEAHTA